MASFTLQSERIPVNTSVSAFAVDAFGNQTGSAVSTVTSDPTTGACAFTGLNNSQTYVAVAGSAKVHFTVPAAAAAGSSPVENVNTVAASGAAQTLPDVTTATIHYVTLTAACTFTFPTAAAGKSFTLVLIQDATGSRTATWPASVKWAGGTAPTLTTTAAKRDVLSFMCADGSTWVGFTAGQNFA